MRNATLTVIGVLAVALGVSTAQAQSDADKAMMRKARALYYDGPAPGSMACGTTIDWDKFVKSMRLTMTDTQKAQFDLLKNVKVSFVSNGADDTTVTVDVPPAAPKNIGDGLKQQITGFMKVYWSLGYGDMFPKAGDAYTMTPTASGYSVEMTKAGTKNSLTMDKDFKVTSMTVNQGTVGAEMLPSFSKEDDGLLHFHGMTENISMGETKMQVIIGFDTQKVSGFYVPQHLSMAVGPIAFDYTLTACEVKPKLPTVNLGTPVKPPASGSGK